MKRLRNLSYSLFKCIPDLTVPEEGAFNVNMATAFYPPFFSDANDPALKSYLEGHKASITFQCSSIWTVDKEQCYAYGAVDLALEVFIRFCQQSLKSYAGARGLSHNGVVNGVYNCEDAKVMAYLQQELGIQAPTGAIDSPEAVKFLLNNNAEFLSCAESGIKKGLKELTKITSYDVGYSNFIEHEFTKPATDSLGRICDVNIVVSVAVPAGCSTGTTTALPPPTGEIVPVGYEEGYVKEETKETSIMVPLLIGAVVAGGIIWLTTKK